MSDRARQNGEVDGCRQRGRRGNNEWGKERVGELAAMQVVQYWYGVVGETAAMDDAYSSLLPSLLATFISTVF